MPGQKNKASGNPMRPIQELIRKLNNKRNDKLDDSYDVMSDKFVRQLDRMSRDEVKAVNPKVKKKIDKDSAVKSLIDRVDKAAGNRRKKKPSSSKPSYKPSMRKPSNTPSVREMREQLSEILLQEYRPDEIIDKFGFDPYDF